MTFSDEVQLHNLVSVKERQSVDKKGKMKENYNVKKKLEKNCKFP